MPFVGWGWGAAGYFAIRLIIHLVVTLAKPMIAINHAYMNAETRLLISDKVGSTGKT